MLPLAVVAVMFAFLGFGCRGGQKVVESLPQITLNYWTVWDEPDAFTQIIQEYQQIHPNVHISVRKISFDNYDQTLLEAWARDEGPDMYSVPNMAVGTYKEFISPMPASLKLPTLKVMGSGCSKNIKLVDETKATLAPDQLDQIFIPAVASDVVYDNNVYGLPLATDTLALFYNKDLLNAAKIIAPPQTWQSLVDMVDTTKTGLTKEEQGSIIQSGIAIGTSKTVNRASDVLAALMLQSGAQMTDPSGKSVTFQNASPREPDFNPGISALNFYTAFANPSRVTYSWNDTLGNAQEAFASGKVAFFLGYSYQQDIIARQNPLLRFGVTSMPQINSEGPEVNVANYWVETVSKKTQYADQAWDFLLFATSEPHVRSYLAKTKKPTALKKILPEQQADLALGVFANQLLVAKNWYHGYDYRVMEQAMLQLIDDVNSGKTDSDSIGLAAQRIQQTYTKQQ